MGNHCEHFSFEGLSRSCSCLDLCPFPFRLDIHRLAIYCTVAVPYYHLSLLISKKTGVAACRTLQRTQCQHTPRPPAHRCAIPPPTSPATIQKMLQPSITQSNRPTGNPSKTPITSTSASRRPACPSAWTTTSTSNSTNRSWLQAP